MTGVVIIPGKNAPLIIGVLELLGDKPSKFTFLVKLASCLKNPYPSKALLSIHHLEFTSYHELGKIIGLANKDLRRDAVKDLCSLGLVLPIKQDTERFMFITKFWKQTYPTSPDTPVMFEINPKFRSHMEFIETIIFENYLNKRTFDFDAINERMNKYAEFCNHHKEQVKEQEDLERNKLGNCQECDRIIQGTAVKGKDYLIYKIGLICKKCNDEFIKTDRTKVVKWMTQKN